MQLSLTCLTWRTCSYSMCSPAQQGISWCVYVSIFVYARTLNHFSFSYCINYRSERSRTWCQHSSTARPPIWAHCGHVDPPADMHLVCHGMPQPEQRAMGIVQSRNMGQLPPVQSRYTIQLQPSAGAVILLTNTVVLTILSSLYTYLSSYCALVQS